MATNDNKSKVSGLLKSILGKKYKHVKLVEPSDGVLFHISTDFDIKVFSPVVSHRSGGTEDRSVPRISCSPSLIDCINGYADAQYDYLDKKVSKDEWNGGYKIYGLPCVYAVAPDATLVPDAPHTNEYWIIPHNPKHQSIKPSNVGKFYMKSANIERINDRLSASYTMYIKLNKPMRVIGDNISDPGYWVLTVQSDSRDHTWLDTSTATIVNITKSEFDKVTSKSVSMMSYNMPTSANW